MKSVIGDGRTIVRSTGGDRASNPANASPTRKTPVPDAVAKPSSNIKKVVTKVSESIKSALSGGREDHETADTDEAR
ncbi:MAG: hypothetical protein JST91_17590 [Actinobacteria bacterium]|nr:hypothetical protein [Actinomycetota bacterium]